MTPGERIAAKYEIVLNRATRAGLAILIDGAIAADRRTAIRALQRERANYERGGEAWNVTSDAINVLRARSRKGKAAKR